jgi:hypothetical protein
LVVLYQRTVQKLHEYIFYILPKSNSAGEELTQQLSRYDQLIKRILWDEKFIDLLDKNKTKLIGISLSNTCAEYRQDYKKLIQILQRDSRAAALYNIELSELMQFIYNQLKIPPTSKVKIEYDEECLLSITRIDDSKEIVPPPFKIMCIEMRDGDGENKPTKLVVKPESRMPRARTRTDTGQFLTVWGSSGSNPGQFNQPKGLTLDEDNNVYVADEFNDRIQKFNSNGNFITGPSDRRSNRFTSTSLRVRRESRSDFDILVGRATTTEAD